MKTIELDEKTRTTIVNALQVAAERYREDAKTSRKDGHPRIARQFDDQFVAAMAAADLIEQAETISVTIET